MIDTHCHIDDEAYRDDWEEMVIRQQQEGVEAIIVPGVDEESVSSVQRVCDRFPHYLYPALGLHPENIVGDGHKQLVSIEKSIQMSSHLVAIGEIGLDYHYGAENRREQQVVYRHQLHWACGYELPVIVHCRDAVEDTLQITQEVQAERAKNKLRGVIHCFSGSKEVAQQWLKMGFYIGVGGVLTFKNCKLGETLLSVPLERVVVETDGPYMSPVPHRGERNESRYIRHVIEKLVTIYGQSHEQIETQTSINARQLFKL